MSSSSPATAAVSFNPERHEYWLDGRQVPSVTQILKATGVSTDFEQIGAMSDRMRSAVEFKRDLGSALHTDIHAFDDNDLEWSTVDDRVLPYLEAWAVFRENTGLAPIARERLVYHQSLNYCGTLDGIFEGPNGSMPLIDVKTGDPHDAAAQFQTAGYWLAFALDHPDVRLTERWSVQLVPDRRVPYIITAYRDFTDFAVWQAIVTTYWSQAVRRRRHV